MDLGSTALTTAVQEIVKSAFGLLKKNGQSEERAKADLLAHLSEVEAWSGIVQIFGMTRPVETTDGTIPLTIDSEPRRFKGIGSHGTSLSELDILNSDRSLIILGDPGSGKTTTLKRLTRLLLTSDSVGPGDVFQYPIVLRLKEANGSSLWIRLADALGLKYHWKQLGPSEHTGRYMCGEDHLENVVSEYLDETRPVVLIDGLDELHPAEKESIERDLVALNGRTRRVKLIATCRTGDFSRAIEGFDVLEIQPLSHDQVIAISKKWIESPEAFLKELEDSGCGDISDRPLFLINLIILFRRTGYLPEHSVDIIERMLMLLIRDWDEQRSIRRTSKYANFTPERKLRFLAALSHDLTYVIRCKRFKHIDLLKAYQRLCESFSLPQGEGEAVAREIEGHTGVIVDVGFEAFEFCHLSVQEFLAAHHMVREPFSEYTGRYLANYSAPVALAVCISSNPSLWLSSLILNEENWKSYDAAQLKTFLRRLITERPTFNSCAELGLSLIRIESEAVKIEDGALFDLVDEILSDRNCTDSLKSALPWYRKTRGRAEGIIYLERKFHLLNKGGLPTPEHARIRQSVLDYLEAEID